MLHCAPPRLLIVLPQFLVVTCSTNVRARTLRSTGATVESCVNFSTLARLIDAFLYELSLTRAARYAPTAWVMCPVRSKIGRASCRERVAGLVGEELLVKKREVSCWSNT